MMRRFEGVRTPSLLFSRSFSEAEKTQLCSLESCFEYAETTIKYSKNNPCYSRSHHTSASSSTFHRAETNSLPFRTEYEASPSPCSEAPGSGRDDEGSR